MSNQTERMALATLGLVIMAGQIRLLESGGSMVGMKGIFVAGLLSAIVYAFQPQLSSGLRKIPL